MSKEVVLLIIDNLIEHFKTLSDCSSLTRVEKLYYGFSKIDLLWEKQNEDEIRKTIIDELNKQFFNNTNYKDISWLILLDFELYRKTKDPYIHMVRNRAYRQSIIDAIHDKKEAFLIPYTGVEPEGCSAYWERLYNDVTEKDSTIQFNLYYRPLIIYFEGYPINYEFAVEKYFNREIKAISEEKIDDRHWIHA